MFFNRLEARVKVFLHKYSMDRQAYYCSEMAELMDVRFKELLLAKKASDTKSVLMLKEEYFQTMDQLNEACLVKLKIARHSRTVRNTPMR